MPIAINSGLPTPALLTLVGQSVQDAQGTQRFHLSFDAALDQDRLCGWFHVRGFTHHSHQGQFGGLQNEVQTVFASPRSVGYIRA